MHNSQYRINSLLKYLFIACLFVLLLYVGRVLFIPLCYGLFVAIILYPVCKWLEAHHFSKAISVTLALSILLLLSGGIAWLLILQVQTFRQDLPMLKEKLVPAMATFRDWLYTNTNISLEQQNEWGKNLVIKMTANPGALVTGSVSTIASALFMLFIIPVFAALFLYNRKDFALFLERLAGNNYNGKLHLLLNKTIDTYFHFIKGMIWVYIIVGILNSIGLLALGIKHAILFGFVTAVMTMIPYIGIFISALLPITVAWITKDSIWYPIGVVAVFTFVQYLEANIIFPRVVSAQLNVSTWSTLIAIIAGGILWGVSGMILFIPFVGILKMITDNIPEWEPLNILLRRSKNKIASIK